MFQEDVLNHSRQDHACASDSQPAAHLKSSMPVFDDTHTSQAACTSSPAVESVPTSVRAPIASAVNGEFVLVNVCVYTFVRV